MANNRGGRTTLPSLLPALFEFNYTQFGDVIFMYLFKCDGNPLPATSGKTDEEANQIRSARWRCLLSEFGKVTLGIILPLLLFTLLIRLPPVVKHGEERKQHAKGAKQMEVGAYKHRKRETLFTIDFS